MITCWFIRRRVRQRLDGANAPLDDVEKHTRTCESCRSFYEAECTVTSRLRDEAASTAVETPSFLSQNIMRRVHQDRPPLESGSFHRFSGAAIAGAAVAVFAIGFFGLSLHHQKQAAQSAQSKLSAKPSLDLGVDVRRIAPRLPRLASDEVFVRWTSTLNHPLEVEAHALLQDAQAAIHLLSFNFLPSTAERNVPAAEDRFTSP